MLYMEQKLWFVTEQYENDQVPPLEFLHTSGEAAIYWFLRVRGGATRIQLHDGTTMHPRTVERAMKTLADRGVIEGR